MFQYDANTGGFAKLGDCVEVVHSGEEVDGLTGTIGGWGDYAMLTALVLLDKPMEDGRTIVGWPVVCLKPTVKIDRLVSIQKKVSLDSFESAYKSVSQLGNLCCESGVIDSDGFIVWCGGDRPVDADSIVDVKLRGGIPRVPVRAGSWPQICWRHRHDDDPKNVWDIVAYKVIQTYVEIE